MANLSQAEQQTTVPGNRKHKREAATHGVALGAAESSISPSFTSSSSNPNVTIFNQRTDQPASTHPKWNRDNGSIPYFH